MTAIAPSFIRPDYTVLALDPGNFNTAYCLLRGDRAILGFGKLPNDEFRSQYKTMLRRVEDPPSTVAIEMAACYGMAVGASMFETCVRIGEFRELALGYAPVVLVVRQEVKLSICKSPKANDSNIRTALIDAFGEPGTKKNPGPTFGISADVWAALGLAETVRRGEFRPYVWSNDRPKQPK